MLKKELLILSLIFSFFQLAANHEGEPRIIHTGMVAPDIISVTIHTGKSELGTVQPILPETKVVKQENQLRVVDNNGSFEGVVIGPEKDHWKAYGKYHGNDINWNLLDDRTNYSIAEISDEEVFVDEVYRVSKPTDMLKVGDWGANPAFQFPMEHLVYLKLEKPLSEGKVYRLNFVNLPLESRLMEYNSFTQRSTALHVNQLGFRPDDPVKTGYLSVWLGKGGNHNYQQKEFHLLDATTNEIVYKGGIVLNKEWDKPEGDSPNINYSFTNVYELDFSDFSVPGEYKLHVEGIGTSYPFSIHRKIYDDALVTSLRSYYHHRSGIALGPPFTGYLRPRCFHPDDGVVVYQSETSLKKMGNANFEKLLEGATDKVLENAWGGLMDAGDWDRRAGHLGVTHTLLDLYALFPAVFDTLLLNIPESNNELPDVVDEALFNLDVYRRLQMDNGAIRGGIESAEHPKEGEVSWLESWKIYAYGPGAMSSFRYAGAAAHAGLILKKMDTELAETYIESAIRAMEWANEELQKPLIDGEFSPDDPDFTEEQNLAALFLYQATGNEKWHQLFLETTPFQDNDFAIWNERTKDYRRAQYLAWSYARDLELPQNEKVKTNCIRAITTTADAQLEGMEEMSFPFVKHPRIPRAWGRSGSYPEAIILAWAHLLTGDMKYLEGVVKTTQFGLGANPINLVYTSGIGINPVKNILHVDSRKSGQKVPDGITVYGNTDNTCYIKDFWTWRHLNPVIYPPKEEWPANQSYYDVYWLTPSTEYTVNHPPMYTAFTWAYLAFR